MAVLPLAQRKALLASSNYGGVSATRPSIKSRKTGFRQVDFKTLPTKQGESINVKEFHSAVLKGNKVRTGGLQNEGENIHKKEITRLDANEKLKKKDREYYEQTLFFSNVYDQYTQYYDYLASIPNGGFRLKAERWRLKASGQKKGWPDTMLMQPRGKWHGLFIEFKKPFEEYKSISDARNNLKPHQLQILRHLNGQGYLALVAYGATEAMRIFKAYLGIEGDIDSLNLFYPAHDLFYSASTLESPEH